MKLIQAHLHETNSVVRDAFCCSHHGVKLSAARKYTRPCHTHPLTRRELLKEIE